MQHIKSWISRIPHFSLKLYLILFITGVALLLRLYNLGKQSLWFDEAYTVFVARLPFIEGWKFLVADGVHPPLFYWIEKVFLIFGESEFIIRLPALIFGVLAVPALYLVGRMWISEGQALFASALLAISPYHIWYSQDARMYSALLFMAIVIIGLFQTNVQKPTWGKRVAFVLLSALAYLTHYFALLLPLIQFIYLAINIRRYPGFLREWTAMQAIAALPILSWIIVLTQREGQFFGIGWIPEPHWNDLLLTVFNFTIGLPARFTSVNWLVVIAILFFLCRALLVRWSSSAAKAFMCLWAYLPALLIFLLSIRRPLYIDRFLIFSIPAILILISKGLSSLGKKLSIASSLLMIALFLTGWYSLFLSPSRSMKENWKGAFAFLDANAKSNELVLLRVLQIAIPMRHYYKGDSTVKALEVNRQVNSIDEMAEGYPGVWLIYWNASSDAHFVASRANFDPSDEKDLTAAAWIKGDGWRKSSRTDFTGVTIFHFVTPPDPPDTDP